MAMIKAVARRVAPAWVRDRIYRLRMLGPAKYARYTRLEVAERRKPSPRANEPFDIGAPTPIVLHASTVAAVKSHWVTEGHPIREFRAFKAVAHQHSCLVDVGAAEGIFSAAFCALTGRTAWAFEPSPTMLGRLSGLRSLNPSFDIRASNLALGAHPGTQAVYEYLDGQFSGVTDETATTIARVTTLDAFCSEHGIAPDLVKIDVEGMELAVLRGGASTFRRSVETILLEVHGAMLLGGESTDDVQRELRDLGFDLFDLDFRPIRDLPAFIAAEPEIVANYAIIVCRKVLRPPRL